MSKKLHILLGGLAAVSLAAQATGVVEINFVEPQKFVDAGFTKAEMARTNDTLAAHFKHFASALPDGQTLRIDVLDVDLAGSVKNTRRGEVRVLRGGADWPSIKLRYTLQAGGNTLQAGEETVADMNYTMLPLRRYDEGELPYEKRMLDDWFQRRLAASAAAPAAQ